MIIYKEYFKAHTPTLSIKGGVKRRHRNPLGTTDVNKHYRRKHLNLVPDYYKAKEDANPSIERIKAAPGRFICSPKDVSYVTRKFFKGRHPMKGEMKNLGGMGIMFYHDGKNWILEKK